MPAMEKPKKHPPRHLAPLVSQAYSLKDEGFTVRAIAAKLSRCNETIRIWFRRYENPGGTA